MLRTVSRASPTSITLADSNYGSDLHIPLGDAVYQVRLTPAAKYHKGSTAHPRTHASILIHHYVSSAANEGAFLHDTMSRVADRLLDEDGWLLGFPRVEGFEPDVEPRIYDGTRDGNVITFEITATVLMVAG